MMDKYKKEFIELSSKAASFRHTDKAIDYIGKEDVISSIEDPYNKIKMGVSCKLSALKTVIDMLSSNKNARNAKDQGKVAWKSIMDRAVNKAREFAFHEMQAEMIPFNLQRAEWLYSRGKLDEALEAWRDVLRINPDNEYVHARLSKVIDGLDRQTEQTSG
jgi:tetratricopeptide (TPR) repeat protein